VEDNRICKQVADLIHGTRESLLETSEYCLAQESIASSEGLGQALISICSFSRDNMEVAASSFKMGVYLGLQYRKLDNIFK
jgi:hypothetical protein